MDTSSLNEAHECGRKAELLLFRGDFDGAAKCHERAVLLLTDAITRLGLGRLKLNPLPSSIKGPHNFTTCRQSYAPIESLTLQLDYHKRQVSVVRMKQLRFDEYKAKLEAQRRDTMNAQENDMKFGKDCANEISGDKYVSTLRRAIYRMIDEQDSLFNILELPSVEKEMATQPFKFPKVSEMIIEDLRTVNFQLKHLLDCLLNQVEKKEQQIQRLTERLNAISVDSSQETDTDEPPSLCSSPLPPLVPLEMPPFDFSST